MADDAQWWPVALAGEVGSGKPAGFSVCGEPVALFRDQDGQVRALEDRCPHRRVPLSLGSVSPEGWLQCGYHGWSFDGTTGKCMAIPSQRQGEKVPPIYGAFAYRIAEQDGVVYLSAGRDGLSAPAARHPSPERVFAGRAMVGLAHEEYVAALLDGPHLLLRCAGIRISATMASDPDLRDGWLTTERAAFWTGQSRFDAFVREYTLIFRAEVRLATGEAWISFARPDEAIVARAHWAATPSARGVTAVLWRSFATGDGGRRSGLLRALAGIGIAPIAPRKTIDMAKIATLLTGPSEEWRAAARPTGLFGSRLTTERARA